MAIAVGNMQSVGVAGWWRDTDVGSAPGAPSLSVANDGDGDAVTATVDGDAGATHQLYYMLFGDTSWTTGESRSGDGAISQAGLTANRIYSFIVVSISGGLNSLPSTVIRVYVSADTADLETAIYHQMAENAVGAIVGTRIYRAGEAPQSVLEHSQAFVTYQRIDTLRERYQGGPHGLAHARVQVSCYAPTPKEVKALADAVRSDWETQAGATGEAGNQVTVKVAEVVDERHFPEVPGDASQRVLHRYDVDLLIWHLE